MCSREARKLVGFLISSQPLSTLHLDAASKNSNKRANMKQKGHPQQQHHHHHPVSATPSSPMRPPPAGASDEGASDADRSLRSPPTIGVHFAAPEEDDVEKSNMQHGSSGSRQQQQPSSPSRRRMTAGAAVSATASEETSQTSAGTTPTGARDQQLGRASSSREGASVSRRRPRSGALPSRGASAVKGPPAPLGGGRNGPLGGYAIQQGGSCRDGGGSSGLLGGGTMAGGGRGTGGNSGPQVRRAA